MSEDYKKGITVKDLRREYIVKMNKITNASVLILLYIFSRVNSIKEAYCEMFVV